jgi:hypothetical protein
MRRILKKLAKKSLELIGRITVGDTVLEVAVDGNMVVGMVNGYRVVDGFLADDPAEKILSALSSIAVKLTHDNWGDSPEENAIVVKPSEWDSSGKYPSQRYMTILVDKLRESLDEKTVKVDGEASAVGANLPPVTKKVQIDLRVLIDNLTKYNQQVALSLKAADRALDRSGILLAKNVSPTIWGADKVQAVLNVVKASLPELEATGEKASRAAALLSRSSEGAVSRIRKGIRVENDDTKFLKNVLIPDVLHSHDQVISYIGSVVAALSPLSNLDRIARNTTGYPASFMFRMSLLDDLSEAYTVLVKFLTDMPQLEMGVFEPLEYIQHGIPSST